MDLRIYYQKIHEVEKELPDAVVVISLETGDGGKAGVFTEVSRRLAAKLVVEGRARVASQEETQKFRDQQVEAKREAEQAAAAGRVQVTVVPSDWAPIKGGVRATKV